jgi:DNA invertase Pin-like site-specific DNA recombinase
MGGVVHLRSVGPFRDAAPAILAAIAKQERMLAGLGRAKAPGKMPGRPRAAVRPERVLASRAKGLSLRAIAAQTGVGFMTVQRIVQAA